MSMLDGLGPATALRLQFALSANQWNAETSMDYLWCCHVRLAMRYVKADAPFGSWLG